MAKRILVAVIFVPILFVVMMFLPSLVWAVLVAAISAMSAWELFHSAGEGKITASMQIISIISAALIPLACWYGYFSAVAAVSAFVVMMVAFICAIRAYDENGGTIRLYHVLLTLFGSVVIPAALSALVRLRGMEQGRYLVLFTVILAFITDGGAYFVGMFLGKHRGITKVSPNKSAEGYVGGFLTGIIYAVLYGLIVGAITGLSVGYLSLILSGFIGALVTELGDLVFSLIKRQCGVKDFGKLLPGHGGMLDRFDSMLFCGPVVLFIVSALPVF